MEEKIIDRREAKEAGILCQDFLFKVSSDDLYVYLEDPITDEESKKKFSKNWEEIKNCLKSHGIQLVLDQPEIIDRKVVVAKAQLPKEGLPERIEFLPKFFKFLANPEELIEKPEEADEDLREKIQKIICASPNEPIAQWYPSIPPTPGLNVWGDIIEPPSLEKEKNFELGKNVFLDEKDNLIKAKIAGVIIYDKGKIEISPEYVLEGDVDFSVGNIHFIGEKLTIKGDIKYGFTVECNGVLELKGSTENKVSIKVEGKFLCDGILRGEDTQILVFGETHIRGAEHCKIKINGNLFIRDYLIFTQTVVEGDLKVTEGKGLIYGGEVCASGNIEAKILGNPVHTKTKISAGYLLETVDTYLKLLEEEEIYIETYEKIHSGIDLASKLKKEGKFSEKHERILEKLLMEEKKIKDKLKGVREALKNFEGNLKELRSKTLKVLEKVYPNVIIQIADITYTVSEEIKGPKVFYLEDIAIKIRDGK